MKSIEEALGAEDYSSFVAAVNDLEFLARKNYDAETVMDAFNDVAAWKSKFDKVVL